MTQAATSAEAVVVGAAHPLAPSSAPSLACSVPSQQLDYGFARNATSRDSGRRKSSAIVVSAVGIVKSWRLEAVVACRGEG